MTRPAPPAPPINAFTDPVCSLDLEGLPPGSITRHMLEIVRNGLGEPVCVPVMVARGGRPGPVFGLTAAVHGNELNGIPVLHQLFRKLDVEALRGTVVAGIVMNIPAYHDQRRQFRDGTDLNHVFPGDPHGNTGAVYAHRVLDRLVRHVDYLLDLHTASFGRINSLYVRADMIDASTAKLAYLVRPQIIVHNPPADGTLRGAAAELGIPAITVEIGNPLRFQPEFIRTTMIGIRAVLAEIGMIRKRTVTLGPEPVLCSRSQWLYTDSGGLLDVLPAPTEQVEEGQLVARLSNVFGDVTASYVAPEPGVVIGRAVNPVALTGGRILHLGVLAPDHDERFQRRATVSFRKPRGGRAT